MIDLSSKTYQNILSQMLAEVPGTFDKRDTSPIPTALGPAAYALEDFYINLNFVQRSAFIQTAYGQDLDLLAVIGGISRDAASAAVRLGVFDQTIPIGSRFSTLAGDLNFACTAAYTRTLTASVDQATWTSSPLGGTDGTYVFTFTGEWTYGGNAVTLSLYGLTVSGTPINGDIITVTVASGTASAAVTMTAAYYTYSLTAETAGTVGNDYSGALLPISVIPNLTYAQITDVLVPGDDTETDDAFRTRLIEALTDQPFGGNIASYRDAVLDIDGVGGVQVWPTWNGGGTVKLSVVGSDFLPASQTVIDAVQAVVDPSGGTGLGVAPIGSTVTVVAPTSVTVNIAATVTLAAGTTLPAATPLIEAALEEYFDSIRQAWDDQLGTVSVVYSADVYYARVMAAILSVQGVLNVSSLTLNGSSTDISLTESGSTQQIPVIGTVIISE